VVQARAPAASRVRTRLIGVLRRAPHESNEGPGRFRRYARRDVRPSRDDDGRERRQTRPIVGWEHGQNQDLIGDDVGRPFGCRTIGGWCDQVSSIAGMHKRC